MMSKRPSSKRPGLRTIDRSTLELVTGGTGQVIQFPRPQAATPTVGVWTPWGIQQVPLERDKK
jgi:hypothetical protein